jgi:arylsulfatase A-like enzyme
MTARNLLIITLDSVRADAFRGPVIDRLVAEGTYFAQAVTCAPSTPESHAAMFSGCYPPIHGLRNHEGCSNDRTPHLLEILEDAGFQVAACTRLASMPARIVGSTDDIAAAAHELRAWGTGRHAMFFHVWRTHFPYLIDAPAIRSQAPTAIMEGLADPRMRATILAGYTEALRCAEREHVARLEELLRAAGAWDDTLVVIWSDHGEAFGAGGEPFHGFSLVDETLRVPVLLRGPGVPAGLRISHQVRTIDLFPTLLELLDVGFDGRFFWKPEGASLVPWFSDPSVREDRVAYAECCAGGKSIGLGRPFGVAPEAGAVRKARGYRWALRMPAWKLVVDGNDDQLFDLARGEDAAVEAVGDMTAAKAKAALAATLLGIDAEQGANAPASGGRALLESLGYLEDAPAVEATSGEQLSDGDGLYASYDLLWPTERGHIVAPRLLHYQTKDTHCELGAAHLYLLGLVGAGRTVGAILADLAERLVRGDATLFETFPQFSIGPAQLAATLERLARQGFLDADGSLADGATFDLEEAVVARPADRLTASLEGLEAVALEQLLAGATRDAALAHARDHARERLCEEARDVLALAAGRHLLRVRKAERAS